MSRKPEPGVGVTDQVPNTWGKTTAPEINTAAHTSAENVDGNFPAGTTGNREKTSRW